MAVTPAGAQVSSAVATNWKKIWKKNLKPLADKRYYTKAQSDAKYQPKGSYETAGSGYTKGESDAKYSAAGSGYTKAESDAKYAPYPKTIRGTYMVSDTVPAAGNFAFSSISFATTLNSAPTVVFKPLGGPANPNCTGTALAPTAAPGFLCIYEGTAVNATDFTIANAAGVGSSSPFGLVIRVTATAAGLSASLGGWAVTPANGVSATRPEPRQGSGSKSFLNE